jgi:predicted Zn-dependent protease
VVTLENDYIQVFVLPEVGGKIWGVIDKTTGQEFIYRNEVMKFRDIAMRGPWTSGGIEFNFGIIGHHPSTATPVDYVLKEHEDGSVSCIVGSLDIPSRTHWRVDITLPPDKSYFETRVLWYNPTPHTQSYYNWMTGAAFATDDLEFFTPGNQYLTHPGEAKPWPIDDQGHDLSKYAENNFGGSKSYHVVGEYNDFFGGYYHKDKYGFGHWSTYEESPGQKLWLWALSRSGGIWEDLLTDTDGQYIEFQAGRLFDQYSPESHQNPITQVPFGSYYTDRWTELWFPFNEIGGLTEVSPQAALHITRDGNNVNIGINGLAHAEGRLMVKTDDGEVLNKSISLNPSEVLKEAVQIASGKDFEVIVEGLDLHYKSGSEELQLKRPFEFPEFETVSASTESYRMGLEDLQFREFQQARIKFEACLEADPAHVEARVALAEVLFRSAELESALEQVNIALSIDTYRPHSNYVAGNIYRAMGDYTNAMESFGWAARAMEFRSAAYTQMSELALARGGLAESEQLARKALHFNYHNVTALQVLAIIYRITEDQENALKVLARLLDLDPLNHLAHFEMSKYHPDYSLEDHFRSELSDQTYLEIAIDYVNKGQLQEAQEVFQMCKSPVASLWLAYLARASSDQSGQYLTAAVSAPIDFVFPYRSETVPVLEWALSKDSSWKLRYYLGLIYWGKNRMGEAADQMKSCASEPDNAVFYLTRADLLNKFNGTDRRSDLEKAMELSPEDWRVWSQLIAYHEGAGNSEEAEKLASKASKKWPDNYNLGLAYAQSLLNNKRYGNCIDQLAQIHILPFEGAEESRVIYENAHLGEALRLMEKENYKKALTLLQEAEQWPERLGVGKPFTPDHRQIDYLQAICYQQLGDTPNQQLHQNHLEQYTLEHYQSGAPANLLGLLSMRAGSSGSKADQIVSELADSDGVSNQWVVAHYRGDQADITKYSEKMKEWDPIGFALLEQMIQLSDN